MLGDAHGAQDQGVAHLPAHSESQRCALLPGHTKLESAVRYIEIEVDDAGEDVSDYAAVIGVAPDGASATACSLRDYASHFALGPVSSLASERKSSASPKGP